MKELAFPNNLVHVLSKSNANYENNVGLNIHQCLFKEAAILDIHEAL